MIQSRGPYGFEDLACGPRPHTKTSSKVFANANFLFVAAGHITMIRELEPLSAVVALGHIIPLWLAATGWPCTTKIFCCSFRPHCGFRPQIILFLTGGYRPHYNYIYATNFSIIIQ